MLATRWESAFSAEVLTLHGYVNLRGAQTLRQIETDFSTRRPRLTLGQSRWHSVSGSSSPKLTCPPRLWPIAVFRTHECGMDAVVTPVAFSPATPVVDSVRAPQQHGALVRRPIRPRLAGREVRALADGCIMTAGRVGASGEVRLGVTEGQFNHHVRMAHLT